MQSPKKKQGELETKEELEAFEKQESRLLPTLETPIDFELYRLLNLLTPSTVFPGDSQGEPSRPKEEKVESQMVFTAFRPILDALIYAERHVFLINELCSLHSFVDIVSAYDFEQST